MEIEISNFLLASATLSLGSVADIFNMFLTVYFSSLAFAAAFPLRDVGRTIRIGSLRLSISSIVVGGTLAAFYLVSFLSFNENSKNAEFFLKNIGLALPENGVPQKVLDVFRQDSPMFSTFRMQNLGFIFGSTSGIVVFLWLTNVERMNERRAKK